MPRPTSPPTRRAVATATLIAAVAASTVAGPAAAGASDAPVRAKASASRTAKAKKKTRTTKTSRTVTTRAGLKRPKTISRKCGRSKSNAKIRRRTSSVSSTTLRVTTRYCGGRTVIQTTRLVPGPTKTVPGPAVPGPTTTVPVPVPVPGPTVTVPGPTVEVPATPKEKSFRLTLLHNNDGESKYATSDAPANYGGVDRFATVLNRLRTAAADHVTAAEKAGAESKGTLTVSSGDNFLAGLNLRASFARFDAGQGPWYDSTALDLLGYDAATIGNHEFDFGPARLAQFIGGTTRTTFLSANTDVSQEPTLQALRASGKIASSTVVQKGGERLGVIGVTPPETPSISSPGKVAFNAAVADVVNAEAKKLTDAGVNKIVLSSHLQSVANERALIPLLENVDIVIAGGGDDLLANSGDLLVPTTGDPAGGFPTPVGNYPLRLADKTGRVVPVVTTAGEYNYVGRLTVTFDQAGHIDQVDGSRSGPVRVSGRTGDPDVAAPDAALKAQVVDPLAAYSKVADETVLAQSEVALNGGNPDPIRQKESNLGDLVADAFRFSVLDAVKDGVIADNGLQTVGLVNGGGIRASIPGPGPVSQGDTFRVLPFNNVISRVPSVPASQLKELLEWGVEALPSAKGGFSHVSGITVAYDVSKQKQTLNLADGTIATPGQRIRTATLANGTKIVENGAVVAGAPAVNVATTDFTARGGTNGNGGDDYPFRKPTVQPVGIAYQQSLEEFLTAPVADGGLNKTVTAARYPVGGDLRFQPVPVP
ncbi:bifunctional UDP-sugar hydrolase/5'-nucleotidase [Patulibacter sp.]|uniref:bifunctional metallophosphatase/5'-nucleotidase n=1 Tax=Patulibacter sp. TaxID=1912859 RepID=UPI00271C03A9|nr:bifunctional metallophosphatase/5'-nucleotidase [Patulibacter sp.]MDO9410437.1 bifunctional metallophosphatase/5'-nucleotidase [Patulibacter sp.]